MTFKFLYHIQVNEIFQDDDPETALEDAIDKNLEASYPMEDVYKVKFIYDYYIFVWNVEYPLILSL